jgi:hypothetical protein
MHLRLVPVGASTYRVVMLRPGTDIGFSTNFFHQTWHVVTSQRGARLLARLLWGLSYQRHPDTLVLVRGRHLLPTPFEAERSDPFLLAPAGITRLDPGSLRVLKSRLARLGPPDRTIRWQTFGLDAALRGAEGGCSPAELEGERLRGTGNLQLWRQERMRRLGGFIVYSAPPAILRQQALRIHGMEVGDGTAAMDYHYLAERSSRDSWVDGEVQVFADYQERVASAVQARHELVPSPNAPLLSEAVQEAVSRRRDWIKARRAGARRRRVRGEHAPPRV